MHEQFRTLVLTAQVQVQVRVQVCSTPPRAVPRCKVRRDGTLTCGNLVACGQLQSQVEKVRVRFVGNAYIVLVE